MNAIPDNPTSRQSPLADYQRRVAEVICPHTSEGDWPCRSCLDAARRVVIHWPDVKAAMRVSSEP